MLEPFAGSLLLLEMVIFFRVLYYVLILFLYFMQFYMRAVIIGTLSRIK